MTKAEKSAFVELIGSVHPKHFVASDTSLIVSYIQAAMMAHRLARKPDRIKEWEMVARTQAALAVKLRLAPSTRSDHKTIARRMPEIFERPWHDDDEARHDN